MALGALAAVVVGASVAFAVPKKFVSGEPLKAADLNVNFDDIEERLAALETPEVKSDVVVFSNNAYSSAQGAFTHVPYKTVANDSLGEWTAATGVFTAKTAGRYVLCAGGYTTNHSVVFELDSFINNTRYHAFTLSQDQPNNGVFAQGCDLVALSVGDTLDVRVYQNTVASASFGDAAYWNTLTIRAL
ncbi:MAG: hypothetical protein U0414_31330 [Polyangiaceae bacterium]